MGAFDFEVFCFQEIGHTTLQLINTEYVSEYQISKFSYIIKKNWNSMKQLSWIFSLGTSALDMNHNKNAGGLFVCVFFPKRDYFRHFQKEGKQACTCWFIWGRI